MDINQLENHELNRLHLVSSPQFELWLDSENQLLSKSADLGSGKTVVIKQLPVANQQDKEAIKTFAQSNRLFESLSHSAFANPSDFALGDGSDAYAFEFSTAATLHQIIDASIESNTAIPIEIAVHGLLEIIDALVELDEFNKHSKLSPCQIELNPNALLITADGDIQITHIGIGNPPSLTQSMLSTEQQVAYYNYLAPEQCVSGRSPDQNCVVFGLGLLCFELLSGRFMFSRAVGQSLDSALERKLRNIHPRLSDVRSELKSMDEVIHAMLNPLPEFRAVDFVEFKLLLNRLVPADYSLKTICHKFFTELIENWHRTQALSISTPRFETTDINELNAS